MIIMAGKKAVEIIVKMQLLLSQNVLSVLKGLSPARDALRDGKHELIHEIGTPHDNHVPVGFLFQMFLFLLLRIILRKRDDRSNR